MLTLPAMPAYKHAAGCYDCACESQDMKDCLDGEPMPRKMSAMHSCMHEPGKRCPVMKQMRRHDMPMNKS
jgi:hypothetical protein